MYLQQVVLLPVQPESINAGIIFCVLILPLIFGVLGAIIFGTQYTLDQNMVVEMDTKIAENSSKN